MTRATMIRLVIEHPYSIFLKFTKNFRLEIEFEFEVRIGISLGIREFN